MGLRLAADGAVLQLIVRMLQLLKRCNLLLFRLVALLLVIKNGELLCFLFFSRLGILRILSTTVLLHLVVISLLVFLLFFVIFFFHLFFILLIVEIELEIFRALGQPVRLGVLAFLRDSSCCLGRSRVFNLLLLFWTGCLPIYSGSATGQIGWRPCGLLTHDDIGEAADARLAVLGRHHLSTHWLTCLLNKAPARSHHLCRRGNCVITIPHNGHFRLIAQFGRLKALKLGRVLPRLLVLLGPHQEAPTLLTAAEAGHVLADGEDVLVPAVVKRQLLARHDLALGEQANRMVSVGLVLPSQVEGHHVRIAAVIYEPCLVTVEHRIDAEWEELVMEQLLDRLLFLVVLAQIVQVKQV